MNSERKTAIIVGILFITATLAGVFSLPFIGIVNEPDYLVRLAGNENNVIIGALLVAIMGFACAGIAIWLYPVLRKHNEGMALAAVGFRIMEGLLFIIAAIGLLSLLTLSQEYVKAGAPAASTFQTSGALLLAVRFWAGQVLGAIAFCLGALMYYIIFFQSRLIPRWLSGWGFIAIILHLVAVVLIMFALINPFSTIHVVINLPIFFQEMVMAVWLIVKGFNPSALPGLNNAKGDD